MASDHEQDKGRGSMDEEQMQLLFSREHPHKTCNQKFVKWLNATFSTKFFMTLFPPMTWLPEYAKDTCVKIRGDIIAGITVAIVAIPQSLSYAALALLNPVTGFYTTIFPSFIYMLFGTSRQAHVGPFALVCLLTAEGILMVMPNPDDVANLSAPINVSGFNFDNYEEAALNVATTMALLVGVFQIGFGLFGIGQVVMAVISDPFVSGFTTGAAFVIAVGQVLEYVCDTHRKPTSVDITIG